MVGDMGADVTSGVLTVAYGTKARREAGYCAASVKTNHPRWPFFVVGVEQVKGAHLIYKECDADALPGREAKTSLDLLTPYKEYTLFLDADTRVNGDVSIGFDLLENGWDMVMVPSIPQGGDALGHVGEPERTETLTEIPLDPLQINTGVIWFRKSTRTKAFFAEWRREWKRWKGNDQGAFLRALEKKPLGIFLLGRPFNSGSIIAHRYGACR